MPDEPIVPRIDPTTNVENIQGPDSTTVSKTSDDSNTGNSATGQSTKDTDLSNNDDDGTNNTIIIVVVVSVVLIIVVVGIIVWLRCRRTHGFTRANTA